MDKVSLQSIKEEDGEKEICPFVIAVELSTSLMSKIEGHVPLGQRM